MRAVGGRGPERCVVLFRQRRRSQWPAFRGAAWAADTYAAPWLSLIANFAGSVLLLMFVRHKRVRRSTKIATAAMLSAAWLCTLIAFLVVE